jgi:hypothetical protein
MDWDAISAVSDIMGAAGVIGSLIYVGLQTRQNTNALRNASVRENMTTFQALLNVTIS